MAHFGPGYCFADDRYDDFFRRIISTFDEVHPKDLKTVRAACRLLHDEDVVRIMGLAKWQGATDPETWRERVEDWSDRETKYILTAIRWEQFQIYYAGILNKEIGEDVEMGGTKIKVE